MPKTVLPIKSAGEEKFLAFEGLVQWAHDVVEQSSQISRALDQRQSYFLGLSTPAGHDPMQSRRNNHAVISACHHFTIAAFKFLEHKDWVIEHRLCAGVDFAELDHFLKDEIRDLRNMQEHAKDYFQGRGHAPGRWLKETPESRCK